MTPRMLPIALVLLAWLVVGPVPPAAGQSEQDIRQALRAGSYDAAAQLGEQEGTALGLALAARALNDHARCTFDGDPAAQRPRFERAFELSGKATELDPAEPEAWLQRARSYARLLNFKKDSMNLDAALDAIRRLDSMLERANALGPARAEAAMARGRVEIGKLVESRVFTGGAFSLFGDRKQAFQDLCRALDLVEREPDERDRALVYYTVADGLWALDAREYAGNVDAYLRKALEPCEDATCRCVQRDASTLRADVRQAVQGPAPLARRICPAS